MLSFITGYGSLMASMFDELAHVAAVILGGCVMWCIVVLVRFIARRSRPRRR